MMLIDYILKKVYYETLASDTFTQGQKAKRPAAKDDTGAGIVFGAGYGGAWPCSRRLAQLWEAGAWPPSLPPEKRQAHVCVCLGGARQGNKTY